MTQAGNDPADAKGLGQSSSPAASKSSMSPNPPGPPLLCLPTPLAPSDQLQQGGQVGWYGCCQPRLSLSASGTRAAADRSAARQAKAVVQHSTLS